MKKNQGFTLIELLVVIAIIGILSSVVLSSLNTARSKGKNAAAKAGMASVRSAAAIYLDDNSGSYGTSGLTCNNGTSVFDPSLPNNINSVVTAAATAVNGTATCANSPQAYVATVPLLNGGNNWCVDSTGFSNVTPLALTGVGSIQEKVACN